MKLDAPVNSNYAATVVRLPKLKELEGCDNLLGAPLFGFQAIVDKSHHDGELGIVFPAETQLSKEFCRINDLYRHAENNNNPEAKGVSGRQPACVRLSCADTVVTACSCRSVAWGGANRLPLSKRGDTF